MKDIDWGWVALLVVAGLFVTVLLVECVESAPLNMEGQSPPATECRFMVLYEDPYTLQWTLHAEGECQGLVRQCRQQPLACLHVKKATDGSSTGVFNNIGRAERNGRR